MAEIIIMGAGIGGMTMAFEMRENARKEDRVTVVSDRAKFHFVPSNPWLAVDWRKRNEIELDVEPLLAKRNINFIPTGVKRVHPAENVLEMDDGSRLSAELPLFDISGGGVGLMAPPDLSALFRRGEVLRECRINLPIEGLVSANVCVRNAFDVTARSGAHHVRVGCEFVDLPAARLSMIQRYITRVERERKARLNGLA